MQYTLTGFAQDLDFRVFTFEGVGEDRVRTQYNVRADLTLTRKYGIRMQELPLLCRGILDRRSDAERQDSFTYTEADMCAHANARREAEMKKPRWTPGSNRTGVETHGTVDGVKSILSS